jgi:hypothetical protein
MAAYLLALLTGVEANPAPVSGPSTVAVLS